MSRPSYHRENLEHQLLTLAAEIVATRGVEALSLRELGKVANVSRSAAYHYFADKAALLHRIGQWGFERLEADVRQAAAHLTDPVARLRAGFHAYVAFSLENPHLMRLMFGGILKRALPNAIAADRPDYVFSSLAAASAFRTMHEAVAALPSVAGQPAMDQFQRTNAFWAAAHGVAMLAMDDNLKFAAPADVLDAVLDGLIGRDAA
jgi:AcrR family transcriptional regulator